MKKETSVKRVNDKILNTASVFSAQVDAVDGVSVVVETDISKGLYAFNVIGLPDKSVEESRDRMISAIKNSGLKSPRESNQKIIVSLAPAQIKKEGSLFDLPIALSYLLAKKEIEFNPAKKIFVGELSLGGDIRAVKGILPIVKYAKESGFKAIFIPSANKKEASLIDGIDIFPANTLNQIIDHITGIKSIPLLTNANLKPTPNKDLIFFEDIKGQETAKRGLTISAAGGHNLALYGPPGTGKTLLAKAMQSILPNLNKNEAIESISIHSIAGRDIPQVSSTPKFRSPHHTSSHVSIVGGGTPITPGEISLSNNGVLFLDEFPEFDRKVIESLREPLEENSITIARASGSKKFPAKFILIAAMNPCPCGNLGSSKPCVCTPIRLESYQKKISGPIVDRIDMWIRVDNLNIKTLEKQRDTNKTETTKAKNEIKTAREMQELRFAELDISKNSEIGPRDIEDLIPLTENSKEVLRGAVKKLGLSPRAYHKIIKCARTIADLDGMDDVTSSHILEAIQYRSSSFSDI